jgi:hypothetical protein
MRNLPSYRDPLWIIGFVLVVVSCLLPWGSGWLVTDGRRGIFLIWFFSTSRFAILALLASLFVSAFGLYYLPVTFGLGNTAFQGITALASGSLVIFGALQWVSSPSASRGLGSSLLTTAFPFEGEILYGAYLAVVAGALIMIAGTDPLIRASHNYIVRKRR